MQIRIKRPIEVNGKAVLEDVKLEDVRIPVDGVMSLDGSTTNTGLSIISKVFGTLYYTMSLKRENEETPVRYKVNLKRVISQLLQQNTMIDKVYYEEPFIGYNTAIPNLMMLRTSVEEIIIENEPLFNYVKYIEINNLKWKKHFLNPEKIPNGTEAQKEAVRRKMESYLPFFKDLTQDEVDSYAMGFTAIAILKSEGDSLLTSKKKAKAFQYNIEFIGADEDEVALQELFDVYDGPERLLSNGIAFTQCKGTENFNKHIYESMGLDDKILVVKFPSNKHGNIVLQYKIGHLTMNFDYIYAIVWRKSRK